MTKIVDADSHWTFPWEFDLLNSPLKKYSSALGDVTGVLNYFMAGFLLQSIPEAERPPRDSFFPPEILPNGDIKMVPDHWDGLRTTVDVAERVRWMDRIGIDYGLVNPGGYAALFPLLEDLKVRQSYIRECNDILADALEAQSGKLGAVSYVDLTDLDWAIEELKRMRARGSRSFVVLAKPVNGQSPAHSRYDKLWSTAVDLGMVLTLHVGAAPTDFGDWGRLDWTNVAPNWQGAFLRMANCQIHQGAEFFLNACLYGGVFERHPNLTVLTAELWTGWIPNFIRKAEVLTSKGGPWGAWPFPKSGGEYLRRNLKVTPLPGLGDWNALELIKTYPEIMVFSSDFPHTEGNADPIRLYQPELDQLPSTVREAFLGENLAECFDRMGDPVL